MYTPVYTCTSPIFFTFYVYTSDTSPTYLLTNYFFLTTLRHAEIKRAEQLLKKAMSQQLTKEAVARAEQRIQSDEDKLLNVLHHAQKSNLAGSSQCPLGRYSTLVFDGHASTASGFKRKCAACPPGKFATGDLQFCVSCAAGTYQRYSASGSCVNCPSGMYQSSEAQTECIDCPASKWQHQPGESFCGRGTCLLLPAVFDGAHSTLHTESISLPRFCCCCLVHLPARCLLTSAVSLPFADCKSTQCPFVVPSCAKENTIPKLQKYWRECCFDNQFDCAPGEMRAQMLAVSLYLLAYY